MSCKGSSETPLNFIFRYKGDSVGRYRRYRLLTHWCEGDPLNYIKIRHGPYMGEERKVILHIATSKDGFIATLDDGLDWLPRPEGDEEIGRAHV